MNSVQGIAGDGYFAAITGGFLGKFTLGWSYSSGHHGLTVGYGFGASLAAYGGKSQTVTTPTYKWDDIAASVLSNDALKSMLPQFGISQNVSQSELATAIFDKFKSSAISQIDQAIGSGKTMLGNLNAQIQSGKAGLSQLESVKNPSKVAQRAIDKARSKVEKLEKKVEKVNDNIRKAEEAKAVINGMTQN